jgi:hypothetical protein
MPGTPWSPPRVGKGSAGERAVGAGLQLVCEVQHAWRRTMMLHTALEHTRPVRQQQARRPTAAQPAG